MVPVKVEKFIFDRAEVVDLMNCLDYVSHRQNVHGKYAITKPSVVNELRASMRNQLGL